LNGKVDAVVAVGDSVRLIPVRHHEAMAQSITPTDRRDATRGAQAVPLRNLGAPVTVASSVAGNSAIHSVTQVFGATFRQAVYEDFTPAADGAIPAQTAISPAGD
jgi:hypothetical protein